MAVTDTDIIFYQSSDAGSTGGAPSVTEIVDSVTNNLWADISDAERIAGFTVYRKWFFTNEHATDAMVAPVAWIESPPTGVTESLAVGFDDADDDEAAISGNMTAWTANAVLAAVSDGTDTRSLTIRGVNNAGVPVEVNLVLTGNVEVATATQFSKVYAVMADSPSATRTVTIRQGPGGTARATRATNRVSSFLWLTVTSKATGIQFTDLAAGASHGVWDRLVASAGISAQRPADSIIGVEEA